MIFIETFLVGFAATLLGSIVGMGLAHGVNALLVSRLNLQITHYAAFSSKALLVTLVFFALLFCAASIFNATAITKKAIERKTGARALRSILEDTMLVHKYKIPELENVSKAIITDQCVNDGSEPIYEYSDKKNLA